MILSLFRRGKKKENVTLIGEGIDLLGEDKGNKKSRRIPVKIPDSQRQGHVFTMGATRSGKTRMAENIIGDDIEKGYSVVWIDPKGDAQVLDKIYERAKGAGRLDDLMYISPIFPDLSIRLDPLSHYFMPEEIVSHVVSGIESKEKFFINVAYEVTLIVVQSLIHFADKDSVKPELNFEAIKKRIGHNNLIDLKDQLEGLGTEESREILASLYQILSSPQDYFAKVSSSLRTVLTALSVGSVGKVIGKAKSNPFLERLENGEGVILVVQTGSLLTRSTAHIVARVILSMIQSYVGRVLASRKIVVPPLCVHIDEASNVLYLGIEDLFNKAGGAGVWLHLMTQSYQDLVAELGEPHSKKILDNANTKIVFRVNDPDTARYVSRLAGEHRRFSPILSLGGGVSVREMQEERILPDQVLRLKPRDFYAFTIDSIYKGRTLDTAQAKAEFRFPQIKGDKNDKAESNHLGSGDTLAVDSGSGN